MRKFITYIILLAVSFSLFSCNKWLDISPKTEVKESENFTNEQGYKDALTGVYLLLTKSSLYGRDLSYGMVDVLGRQYTSIQSSSSYYYLSSYDYTNQTSINIIDAVWSNAYNAIANLNVLISHIDSEDPTLFTATNRDLIRGEAYGLRAFIHFDLLRLFGPSVINGADEPAIPYVKTVGKDLTQFSTVNQA
ncbi:MAG: RagB/SusD family nutrient uptake outer membrane protein, partial [Bacteroidales bacterium]|nr:RagB/SusD family nutrient uptake outer membrane protein [Bacteroidales bacterium]